MPDQVGRLPAGWRPPCPYRVTVHYRHGDPQELWTAPFGCDASGTMVYLAAGPAGQPTRMWDVTRVDIHPDTDDNVHLAVQADPGGPRFGQPQHTMN